jgi:hypothetical protein
MAGTTNFQQFNPTQANQESDAAYTADSTRSNGAGVGAIFPSNCANKLFYQTSTGVAALMQMLANKGFSTNDSNLAVLAGALSCLLTTADIKPAMAYAPFSPSIILDASLANGWEIVLTANTSITIISIVAYQPITLAFSQDGVGGHSVTFTNTLHGLGAVDGGATGHSQQTFMVLSDLALHATGPMVVS